MIILSPGKGAFDVVVFFPDVVDDMMAFYLATFQSLRVQMGIPAIQHTITIFLDLFTGYFLRHPTSTSDQEPTLHQAMGLFVPLIPGMPSVMGRTKAALDRILAYSAWHVDCV